MNTRKRSSEVLAPNYDGPKKKRALTSTERSRRWRENIYADNRKHREEKKKDNERKKLKAVENAIKRDQDAAERERYREYQKEKKRRYRQKKKDAVEKVERLSTPQKLNVKNRMKCLSTSLRRHFTRELAARDAEAKASAKEGHSFGNAVSKVIWGHLSPGSKQTVARRLKVSPNIPRGVKKAIRDEVGINLSNPYEINEGRETELQREIRLFFERTDVARPCPDTKRMVNDPREKGKRVPVRFRLGTIKVLYWRFQAETGKNCSMECFRQNIPFDVIRPKANDWGTCLCAHCINPEMKLEALSKLSNDPSLQWDDSNSYESIDDFISRVKAVDVDQTILYNEWQKLEIKKSGRVKKASKRITKVSRKVPVQEKLPQFKKKLVTELNVLKDHLMRVHSQYKAFKLAREQAEQDPETATIQIDWSENRRLTQSAEEKGAYYFEDQVSLHPAYVWSSKGKYSKVSMGDSTDHTAPAVMASILPLLEDLVESGIKHLNVISDSPTSQYRNKGMFWLIKTCCEEFGITVTWIYLESGHGKGIPDGIGATVKRSIEDLMLSKPSVPMYSVADLLDNDLEESVPSIGIYTYEAEDIIKFRNAIPKLKPMKGTMKLHEIKFTFENDGVVMAIKDMSSETTARHASLQLDIRKSRARLDDDDDDSENSEDGATKDDDDDHDHDHDDDSLSDIESLPEGEADVSTHELVAGDRADRREKQAAGEEEQLTPRPISTVKVGDWVVVLYEEERFIGKVVKIANGQAAVQCLEKPLGINVPQELEKDDSVFYETVYTTAICPKLIKVGRNWKWVY